MFLDVSTGFLDSVHDARMLRASALYQKYEANGLLTRPEKLIEENVCKTVTFRRSSLPVLTTSLTTWLVKPYPSNIRLTDSRKKGIYSVQE